MIAKRPKHIKPRIVKCETLHKLLKRFKLQPKRFVVFSWNLTLHHQEQAVEMTFTGFVRSKKKRRRK